MWMIRPWLATVFALLCLELMFAWKVHGDELLYCGTCEGTLAGDWGLDVWWAGSKVTSWSPCLGNPFSLSVHVMVGLLLPSWIWQRWWNVMCMIALQKVVPSVLLKATLSLAGFVKASDCSGELGPQCSQTAESWDISPTALRGWIPPIDVLPALNVVIASGASWLTFLIISTAGWLPHYSCLSLQRSDAQHPIFFWLTDPAWSGCVFQTADLQFTPWTGYSHHEPWKVNMGRTTRSLKGVYYQFQLFLSFNSITPVYFIKEEKKLAFLSMWYEETWN